MTANASRALVAMTTRQTPDTTRHALQRDRDRRTDGRTDCAGKACAQCGWKFATARARNASECEATWSRAQSGEVLDGWVGKSDGERRERERGTGMLWKSPVSFSSPPLKGTQYRRLSENATALFEPAPRQMFTGSRTYVCFQHCLHVVHDVFAFAYHMCGCLRTHTHSLSTTYNLIMICRFRRYDGKKFRTFRHTHSSSLAEYET